MIAAYIAQDSPRHALAFIDGLREACEGLAIFPRRFPVVRGRVRKALHGSYLIFFTVGVDVIHVIHILHAASDYGAELEP